MCRKGADESAATSVSTCVWHLESSCTCAPPCCWPVCCRPHSPDEARRRRTRCQPTLPGSRTATTLARAAAASSRTRRF
eukprot:scaffold90735_cov72-Phaeocystis_antarctica.AAC.3